MPRPLNGSKLLGRNQIHSRIFAALVDFDIEFEPVAFVQATQACTFDRRNMDKCIGLAIIALDKAETFHRVEELDRAGCLLTGQLALWATAAAAISAAKATTPIGARFARAIFHGHRFALDLELGCRNLAAAIDEREAQRLPFRQSGQTSLFDRGNVYEHILAAIVADDEAEALLAIEEFYDASAFTDDLRWHRRARSTAAAATKSTAAAAAEAIAAAAEAVSAATETITACCGISTIAVVAEAVALVPAAPAALTATPFIKTHALYDFPEFIVRKSKEPKHRTMAHMVFGAEPLRTFESQ